MAFSFRAGTNWCHDFPKLARESGFYFNMHTARVRVDWNRISSIDVDRVIRERDFQTVDENVNNVIDYYLESEYDVKILDPNFVKLFRLAQLAVEYLLYCKQYLDQSVVILKEELKYKLEENVKLKEEILRQQDAMKEMKEKYKEKTKTTEIKSDIHGEIHKCPHCPKTFVSASFAKAHLLRRHPRLAEASPDSSPAHEVYRAETEKLHNEIKTLKERLNQTERVIRNESGKLEDDEAHRIDQYRKYQEEIGNLKAMLFTEIRNIKKKESDSNQQENQKGENIKELVSQQENEIERLKKQLQEHLTSNTNEVQIKLVKQEEYWKSKIDHLENQHRKDIENLFSQLKLTQDSAIHMKSEYEDKINFLEKQSMDQSKLLTAQSEQLNTLTRGMLDSQNKKSAESYVENKKVDSQRNERLTDDTLDSESSQVLKKSLRRKFFVDSKSSPDKVRTKQSYSRLVSAKKEDSPKQKSREIIAKESNLSSYKDKKSEKLVSQKQITKAGKKYASLDEFDKSDASTASISETESEEDSDEETSETSATRTESTNDEAPSETDHKIVKRDSHHSRRPSTVSLDKVKEELLEVFENKLKDLGIDPEWDGIPVATYRQKVESIRHHQNISSKKYPKYEQIRRKLLEEVSRRISLNQKSPKRSELDKKSFLNKAMKNVKSKALKALNEFKIQKSNDTSTPVLSSKASTPRETHPKRRFSLELLPKKPTQQDIQEIKRQAKLESEKKEKSEEPTPRPKSGLRAEDIIRQTSAEPLVEPSKRTKQLQRSYQSIEEFMRDIDETPKLDMASTKVTSTPSKNVQNILQDTYTFANDSDGQLRKQDTWSIMSPKNKSVLKSTSGVMGSVVKKKVIFDLEKEASPERNSMKSIGEFIIEEDQEKNDLNDSDWNISSISEEKEQVTVKEKTGSTGNIQLKTSQSEKINELSRKIQEKLEASRRKPAGSIEAMFMAKTFTATNDKVEVTPNPSSMDKSSSILNSPSHGDHRSRSNASQLPRPAPRRQLFDTKDSSLNMDIDELLAIH